MSEVQHFRFVCVAAALMLPLHKLSVYLIRLQSAVVFTVWVLPKTFDTKRIAFINPPRERCRCNRTSYYASIPRIANGLGGIQQIGIFAIYSITADGHHLHHLPEPCATCCKRDLISSMNEGCGCLIGWD